MVNLVPVRVQASGIQFFYEASTHSLILAETYKAGIHAWEKREENRQ